MRIISLQSGSNGNCIYVEGRDTRLLLDAGISGIRAHQRLAARGRDIARVDAVVVSHDHSDHVRSLGVFQRKFGLPVHVTRQTLAAAQRRHALGQLGDVCHFEAAGVLRFGGLTVETIRTPHDGADGVAFVIDDGENRFGVLTDLGHAFDGLERLVRSLDAVLIESNYDPEMLDKGPYPAFLKQRIRGPAGHLSNQEAARLLRGAARERLRWACLGHLSEENNRPEIALRTHRDIVGDELPLCVASRHEVSEVMEI
jgi:phosphoribosyl 1,2-cyclic phosphodiesterase